MFNDIKLWSRRYDEYRCGPILGMYREKKAILMNYLDLPVDVDRLKFLLVKSINISHKDKNLIKVKEENSIGEDIQRKRNNDSQKRRNADIDKVKQAKNLQELLDALNHLNQNYSIILEELKNEPVERQLRYLELYLEYEEHKKMQRKGELFSDRIPELDKLYASVFKKKSVYNKYGLLPVDKSRMLKVMNPPRIYDSALDKTIFLSLSCSQSLVEILNSLYEQGLIGEMSFKGSSNIFDGTCEDQRLSEDVERGKLYSFDFNHFVDVTKLYSETYNDQLWIIKDGNNLYFEELDEDFDEYEDSVVTRMLHAEIEDDFYICHMDFEYIFYSLEEFEKRKQEPNTKGTYKKRCKLFKIDKCQIPFDYKVEMLTRNNSKIQDPLFYFILNLYFKHTNLLNEYFSRTCG